MILFKDIIREVMKQTKREPLRSEPKCDSPVGIERGRDGISEVLGIIDYDSKRYIHPINNKINYE